MASSEATEGQVPDLYGQLHPVESPELIVTKQKAFGAELEKIPIDAKKHLLMATEKCPELLSDDFKLMFLRCEVFNADLAAKRFVAYWDKRVEIFGEERAFRPLTVANMDDDDLVAGKLGIMNIINRPGDRSIIFYNVGKQDKSKYTRMNLVRIGWYMLHVALESSIETQQKGMIFLGFPRHGKMSEWDSKFDNLFMSSVQGCIPIRVSAMHICHPPMVIFRVIWPIARLFLSKQTRKRVRVHGGTDERVNTTLQKDFGFDIKDIPVEMGGQRIFDPIAWFDERAKIEQVAENEF